MNSVLHWLDYFLYWSCPLCGCIILHLLKNTTNKQYDHRVCSICRQVPQMRYQISHCCICVIFRQYYKYDVRFYFNVRSFVMIQKNLKRRKMFKICHFNVLRTSTTYLLNLSFHFLEQIITKETKHYLKVLEWIVS